MYFSLTSPHECSRGWTAHPLCLCPGHLHPRHTPPLLQSVLAASQSCHIAGCPPCLLGCLLWMLAHQDACGLHREELQIYPGDWGRVLLSCLVSHTPILICWFPVFLYMASWSNIILETKWGSHYARELFLLICILWENEFSLRHQPRAHCACRSLGCPECSSQALLFAWKPILFYFKALYRPGAGGLYL